MDYSGEATFEECIVRRFENGKWIPCTPSEEGATDIELVIKGRAYFASGKYSGPPEYSYPDEGEEEILSALDKDGRDWSEDLTEKEIKNIHITLAEQAQEDYDDRITDAAIERYESRMDFYDNYKR